MRFAEYADYDGLGLAHLVRKGEVSPLELLEEAIARIEKHNGVLNAVVYKAYDEARAVAKGKLADGPFKGVPFLIKDINMEVAGWPMSNGSALLEGYVSKDDTELTKRYRAAGMVLAGKTNTPEFGIPGTTEGRFLGNCHNPWNPAHSSGGSSGGAAAAVASGIVPMAHASDGLGSIRIPAAQCGLFGMKPTQSRNPGGRGRPGRAGRVRGMSSVGATRSSRFPICALPSNVNVGQAANVHRWTCRRRAHAPARNRGAARVCGRSQPRAMASGSRSMPKQVKPRRRR